MPGGIIYGLYCRPSGKWYVGQTVQPLAVRLRQHLNLKTGRANLALFAALAKYGPETFEARLLERVSKIDDLDSRERYWTDAHHALAPGGYNLKAGARSLALFADSVRAKFVAREARKWSSPGANIERQRLSDWMKARWANPRLRPRLLHQILKRLHDPDVEAKRSATQSLVQRVVQGSPKARLRRAEISRTIWADPDSRARILASHAAAMSRPETRRRMSIAAKERANRPLVQARRVSARRATRVFRNGRW